MKAFMNWSGGKDSAFCLYKSFQEKIPVEALVTSMNESTDRVTMHGVRKTLIESQAASIGLPLYTIQLGDQPSMNAYESAISNKSLELKEQGFTNVISGDLFLEDLKNYREQLYTRDGIRALFPIWKYDSWVLLREFIDAGFKAIIICVNGSLLDKSFCGRLIDDSFIQDLPAEVDPCGENGEYHSFVYDGPIFSAPIPFHTGEIVNKTYKSPVVNNGISHGIQQDPVFYFQDIEPG